MADLNLLSTMEMEEQRETPQKREKLSQQYQKLWTPFLTQSQLLARSGGIGENMVPILKNLYQVTLSQIDQFQDKLRKDTNKANRLSSQIDTKTKRYGQKTNKLQQEMYRKNNQLLNSWSSLQSSKGQIEEDKFSEFRVFFPGTNLTLVTMRRRTYLIWVVMVAVLLVLLAAVILFL